MSAMWEVDDEQGSTVTLPEERIVLISADNKKLKVTADDGVYWVKMPLMAGLFLVGHGIIWTIMHLRCKAATEELNVLLQESRQRA